MTATGVTLSLISHTNAGKTTLARTLLAHDVGEVRDAPHVTVEAAAYPLVTTADEGTTSETNMAMATTARKSATMSFWVLESPVRPGACTAARFP